MRSQGNVVELDLQTRGLREINQFLHQRNGTGKDGYFRILNPNGAHALACGVDAAVDIEIDGHTGYYCAGMNKLARITVNGNVGVGIAENMMSGEVRVKGDASQSAGATAHGGLLVVEGNTSARCGISLKGADIVVKGSVGHMSCFLAQAGRLVVLGDAGEALGDSLYEAQIYVRGKVKSLGADCIEKPLTDRHKRDLERLLKKAGCDDIEVGTFQRYGSARKLYNFEIDNISSY
jgi:glutamate synthase domain-containing protein 3